MGNIEDMGSNELREMFRTLAHCIWEDMDELDKARQRQYEMVQAIREQRAALRPIIEEMEKRGLDVV